MEGGCGRSVLFLGGEIVEEGAERLVFFVWYGKDESGGAVGVRIGGWGVGVAGETGFGQLLLSEFLWGVPKGSATQHHERYSIVPCWCHSNVDRLIAQELLQETDGPSPCGSPIRCRTSHHEGGVPRNESHELERARLLGELFDNRAVEFIVSRNEFLNRVLNHGVIHGRS